MAGYKIPDFNDRAGAARAAKQAALDKLRDKPAVDPAVVAERLAASEAREAAAAERRAAKLAAEQEAKAAKAAEKAAQLAAEQAEAEAAAAAAEVPKLTAEEMKAARDARYAARKARKK